MGNYLPSPVTEKKPLKVEEMVLPTFHLAYKDGDLIWKTLK